MAGTGIEMETMFKVRRSRPRRKMTDGSLMHPGVDGLGKLLARIMSARDDGEAEDGSYFCLSNATPGTGLATIAALASFVDTSPFILVKNDAPKDSGERIRFRYLRLQNTAPGTAGAAVRFAVQTDGEGKRYTSGATGIYNPSKQLASLNCVNVNQDDETLPGILAYAGPIVAAAASESARQMDAFLIRPVIPVIGDTYLINFGGPAADIGAMAPAGTAIAHLAFQYHPVVIGPQQWARGGHFIDAPAGPGVDRRIDVGKIEFIGRQLAAGVHVPLAQEQDELLLGEIASTVAMGSMWKARSQAAYQGYSHLSGMEMTSRL
jgi:hypothetical protein